MAQRKLQQEMDRVFKRVAEGVIAFDSIYEKVQLSSNQSQKEKLESDLKREIKKLQRLRDQIKTWMGSNDIKDKKVLTEQRKLIETEMERFKACEKEMKTKAYSKEGLTNSMRLDPREKEKVETANFISSMLEELERQVEAKEAEQEIVQASMKKGRGKDTSKAERLSDIEHSLERHRWHISKLENILRMLENGNIVPDTVNAIQEDIKYYVESNEDADFAEDEEIYDELNLEEEEYDEDEDDEDNLQSPTVTQAVPTSAGSSTATATTPIAAALPTVHSTPLHPTPAPAAQIPTSSTNSTTGAGTPASNWAPLRKPSIPHNVASTSTSNVNASSAVASSVISGSIGGIVSNSTATAGLKPAPVPVRSTDLKYASAAAASVSVAPSIPHGLSPLPPPPPSKTVSDAPSSTKSPAWADKVSSGSGSPAVSTATPIAVSSTASSNASLSSSTAAPVATNISTAAPTAIPSGNVQAIAVSGSGTSTTGAPSATPPPDLSTSISTSSSASEYAVFSLPPGLQDLIGSFDAAKKRLGTPPPISTIAKLLEASYVGCPDSLLADKPRYYHSQSPFPTPKYYPQEPMVTLDDPTIISKMDVDTLFYIFYYRQGTYQQYLAAKELKNRSWRFHKRFLTWFQRHEEPKAINNDFEQGTYRYFDFEGMWLQRRKSNFKFEYQFLEDEI